MEWVSLIRYGALKRDSADRLRVDWKHGTKSDHPACTNRLVADAAISVNDALGDRDRGQLAHLIPRLLRAGRARDSITEFKISVRLLARLLRHAVRSGSEGEGGVRYLDQIEQLVRGQVTGEEFDSNSLPYLRVRNSNLSLHKLRLLALRYAGGERSTELLRDLNYQIAVGFDCLAPEDVNPAIWLSEVLDAHEKIRADEGELLWDPEDDYISDRDLAELVDKLDRG